MKRLSFRAVRFSAGCVLVLVLLHLPTVLQAQGVPKFDLAAGPLELSGPANPWRFVNAVGEKAGIWGFESGVLEGLVYPLKVGTITKPASSSSIALSTSATCRATSSSRVGPFQ
jgi:hypothetical protein